MSSTTWSAAHGPLFVAQLPVENDGKSRIRRLLIANRGEIACRILATCRKLQINTISVYVDEDATSRHVAEADEAINLGSVNQSGGNPFLNIDLLVQTAVRAGAHAIHPGYGYLSENAMFADAVRAAGIIFVGPSSAAMSTLGDKRQAKDYLSKNESSVPLIPGFTGSSTGIQQSDLEAQSERIGFPVMIKASAGGGGRGMRIVHDKASLAPEFERAQSEAKRSFGLADCILEKYIEAGKHVEVQIMGDSHGRVVSLWERDCSVQRRHQKVVEESPCSWLSQEQREKICGTAVKIGELLKYEGAGTVEFIVDISTGNFYFLEVNARLQVEHPITEQCTGLDVVALQLFVASSGSLAELSILDKVPQRGHAIECRICAEDPNREFAPQHGLIRLWAPWEQENVRFEAAIESGTRVSIYFDSMIAKVVVWSPNRTMAIKKMVKVLANTACVGVTTNQLFLQSCLLHPAFRQTNYSTAFIPNNIELLLQNPYLSANSPSPSMLSLVPSLFLRYTRDHGGKGSRKLFGSIRSSFRNQTFDRVNVPSDIVTLYDPAQGTEVDPRVCLWTVSPVESAEYTVATLAPLPQAEEGSKRDDAVAQTSTIVTRAYNALSTAMRMGTPPQSVELRAKIYDIRSREISVAATGSWRLGKVDISVNDKRLLAYISTGELRSGSGEADTGDYVRVFCHVPAMGTSYEYHCYSRLSYFEGQRLSEAGALGADLGTIKAHMPCKVLQILKNAGDAVKIGEIVMVVESMKMEITIPAGKDGKFETSAKEGDAMDEGQILCKLL